MAPEQVPAFATPAALPRARRVPALRAVTPITALPARRVVHLAVSTQRPTPQHADPSRRSKRDPTFRKLQRKHRQGPAAFRQAREGEERGPGGEPTKPGSARVVVAPRVRRPRFREDGTPLRELVVGTRLSGIAQNTVPHGVYVDVGATVDGLVHVRDMAIDFVHEPEDLVRTGDRVTVWVKYVDAVANVLGLSMLRPARGDFADKRTPLSELEVGSRLLGVVHRVTNFGAYVDVGATRPGFVHVTALWGPNPRDTLEGLRLGADMWVHVAYVDTVSSHIVLLARSRGGDRLDEFCEADDGVVVNSRGWLLDDGPIEEETDETSAPVKASTKVATLRPGEELVDDEEEGENGAVAEEDEDAQAVLVDAAGEEDDEDDEFAFANDAATLQFGGAPLADVADTDESAVLNGEDEFAFAEESKLMQSGTTQLGQLAGLIDSDTELVGFEEDDDLLGYLREKQVRRKERELAEMADELEGYDEDEDEDEDADEDEDEEDDEDEVDEEFEGVDEVDIDGQGRNDLQSLLHSDVDF